MLHIIVNPNSGTGIALKTWNEIQKFLNASGTEYKVYMTSGLKDATRFSRELSCTDEDFKLVVLGGDGTLNEVICGITDFSKVTLGYIPSGSSNDFARSIGLNKKPLEILASIINPSHIKEFDVGNIYFHDGTSRNFLVSIGIGFDAAICHRALHSKIKNFLNYFHLGKITYAAIAFREILPKIRCGATIELDDAKSIPINKFYFITCMLEPYEGGGYMFCPNANGCDGFIDICAFCETNKFNFAKGLLQAAGGKHTSNPFVSIYKAKKIKIKTKTPHAVHADGESCGFQSDIVVTILESKLKLIVD